MRSGKGASGSALDDRVSTLVGDRFQHGSALQACIIAVEDGQVERGRSFERKGRER
jgi:hypothetical protein